MQVYIWLILFGVFLLLELMTPTALVSIWFAIGALAGSISSLITDSLALQMGIFVAVSVLSLILLRPICAKYFNKNIEKTNADRVIGKIGIVQEEIDDIKGTGTVLVGGAIWSAKGLTSENISPGTRVKVISINGVKVLVKKEK